MISRRDEIKIESEVTRGFKGGGARNGKGVRE